MLTAHKVLELSRKIKSGKLDQTKYDKFFPAKPLGCYGDGGAIFSNNEKISKKIKSLRNHGQGKDKYNNIRIGMNSRLDTIQAAILIEKLKIFKKEIQLRNNTAEYYNKNLSTKVKVPEVNKNNLSVWAQYTIKVKKEKNLLSFLMQRKFLTQSTTQNLIIYKNHIKMRLFSEYV